MRIDKLAMTSREALQTAMSTAADAQAGAVEPIHLLSALLGVGERNISVIIERIGADPAQLARSTQDAIDHSPKVSGEGQQMGLSNELVRVIEKAEKKATKMGDSFVVTEHLLMATWPRTRARPAAFCATQASPRSASSKSTRSCAAMTA